MKLPLTEPDAIVTALHPFRLLADATPVGEQRSDGCWQYEIDLNEIAWIIIAKKVEDGIMGDLDWIKPPQFEILAFWKETR